MDIELPLDFKEFLRLLDANRVEYLLIGGYAVGYHGYPRATGDIDIWIARNPANAQRMPGVESAAAARKSSRLCPRPKFPEYSSTTSPSAHPRRVRQGLGRPAGHGTSPRGVQSGTTAAAGASKTSARYRAARAAMARHR